jgi:hypothetical protein
MIRDVTESSAEWLRQPYVLPANQRRHPSGVPEETGELVQAAIRAVLPDEHLMDAFLQGDVLERPQG